MAWAKITFAVWKGFTLDSRTYSSLPELSETTPKDVKLKPLGSSLARSLPHDSCHEEVVHAVTVGIPRYRTSTNPNHINQQIGRKPIIFVTLGYSPAPLLSSILSFSYLL